MNSKEIREKFIEFFEKRGHMIVPSSSLLPDDPSVLLTTAGMQQFKPYFLGEADPLKDFGAKRTASIQKAFRTSDIDEVGDESHLTFFQMLGHFSFGDYFKKETIEWTYEILTDILKISSERISVTVFAGDEKIPFDNESYDNWALFLKPDKIKRGGREGNIWGPPGPEGPCGAANEVYVDGMEIATLVFMEFYSDKSGNLTQLSQKGVDVGWGLERITMVLENANNVFETDLLKPFMEFLPQNLPIRVKRIITDHLRSIAFLLADGLRPSNKEAGYILRRLMRRVFVYENIYKVPSHIFDAIVHDIVHDYGEFYKELLRESDIIREEFSKERDKFNQHYPLWKKYFKKAMDDIEQKVESGQISKDFAERVHIPRMIFILNSELGMPADITKEWLKERGYQYIEESLLEEFKKHQEISRAGQERKFGGHGLLLDTGELKAADEKELKKVTRLHTATHLLNAALHKVLGDTVEQRGSDITVERTRFDFLFPRKLTTDEIQKIEDLVNYAVDKNFLVKIKEMPLEEAKKSGALYFYKGHYPEMVKVYSIGDHKETFSRELCGGPHVKNTEEIGRFKITKEEASSAGVRRIRAVVE